MPPPGEFEPAGHMARCEKHPCRNAPYRSGTIVRVNDECRESFMAIDNPTALPPVVTREEWHLARERLLEQEKAHMRAGDALAAARRRLPMVEIDKDYTFQGEHGDARLIDLFAGRRQLIVQHFMFGPDWDEGCVGCSMMADHVGSLAHLHARGTSFVMVSRAPLEKLLAYRARMGWQLPWYSSHGTDFNEDFHATVDGEEHSGLSTFLRDGDRIFHTWSTTSRGVEPIVTVFDYLDLTPYGRQEAWEDSPAGWPQTEPYSWWRRHDQYEPAGEAHSCH
jgi:predicted dithiol-disulfide oxidoreductase (DUF899 family)